MEELKECFYFIYDEVNHRYLRKFKNNHHYRIRVFQSEKAAEEYISRYTDGKGLKIIPYKRIGSVKRSKL